MKPLLRALVVTLGLPLAIGGVAGCALTSKADVVTIRYFTPEGARPRVASPGASAGARSSPAVEVRLGRVSSGPSLRERITYRDADHELGYYDELRWTERPETYVRRELGRRLFEEHGLRRAFAGSAPTLDVELVAFDDLRLPGGRATRITMKVLLFDDTGTLYEETVSADRPVSGERPRIEDVVATMAATLDVVTEQTAVRVESELGKRRATRAAAAP